jgi:tetratricopeptide (TPR) repeat protein
MLADAYNNRGIAYDSKGQYDQAIADYNNALEINPRYAMAYYNRGIAYYFKKEYDKSLENVKKAQELGDKIDPKFLEDLSKASGRKR